MGIPILGILKLQLGNPGTKWHLGASPMARHIIYYKGERWWLPPNLGCGESVSACGSSVHQKCFSYALINLLFGLCKFVWIIELLVNIPSPHPRVLAHPSTPEVLWTKECGPTFSLSVVFTFGLAVNPSKSLGVCHIM